MAGFYTARAEVLVDGVVVTGTDAVLSVQGTAAEQHWGGVLHADPQDDLLPINEAGELLIRLTNGNEAKFDLLPSADLGTGFLPISGVGAPPF
ncbi:hypothetical protein [Streptomyces sp. NPDC048248]|uniref:hypothetical protein n=1 Tax=Streptomyces sp. NPDC048248 TaxID=3365523 RepID=UPI0037176AB8